MFEGRGGRKVSALRANGDVVLREEATADGDDNFGRVDD